MALKMNRSHDDFVLRELSSMLLDRNLLKIKFTKREYDEDKLNRKKMKLQKKYGISAHESDYFVCKGFVYNSAYAKAQPIKILSKNQVLTELVKAGREDSFKALTKKVVKYYYCHPKIQD